MFKEVQLRLTPEIAADETACRYEIAKQLNINVSDIDALRLQKRSIDARKRQVFVLLQYGVWVGEKPQPEQLNLPGYRNVQNAETVVVVGAGPGGLFAALRLIELGIRPIVVERGKDVSSRKVAMQGSTPSRTMLSAKAARVLFPMVNSSLVAPNVATLAKYSKCFAIMVHRQIFLSMRIPTSAPINCRTSFALCAKQ